MHYLVNQYETGGFLSGRFAQENSVMVICSCGWRGKGLSAEDAEDQFKKHRLQEQKVKSPRVVP